MKKQLVVKVADLKKLSNAEGASIQGGLICKFPRM